MRPGTPDYLFRDGIILSQGILTVGRADYNDLVIDSPAISHHHAKIITFNRTAYIEDMGSTNGTKVNGIKKQHQRLREGDQVTVGDYTFTIIGFE